MPLTRETVPGVVGMGGPKLQAGTLSVLLFKIKMPVHFLRTDICERVASPRSESADRQRAMCQSEILFLLRLLLER